LRSAGNGWKSLARLDSVANERPVVGLKVEVLLGSDEDDDVLSGKTVTFSLEVIFFEDMFD
jgi:hypothetical protein